MARHLVGSTLYTIRSVPESPGFHMGDVVACHEKDGEVIASAVVTPSAHRRLVIEFAAHIAESAIRQAVATLERQLQGKGRLLRERRYIFGIPPAFFGRRRKEKAELKRFLEGGPLYGGFTYEQDAW